MAADAPADLSMMFVIHRAFRRDLARLQLAVAALPDGAGERARALAAHWRFVADALHHHHTGEDEHIWPLVRRKAPEAAPLLDEMTAEHALLDPLLERAQAGFDRLVVGDDTARTPLAATLRELGDVLGAHLDHEERDAVPVVERSMTQRELKAFETSQRKSLRLADLGMFVPWLLEGMDAEQRRRMLGVLPPPLRLLAQRRWEPRYARTTAALWS